MQSQTHILVASGLLARRNSPAVNIAAVVGGFVPDLPLYAMYFWNRAVMGVPDEVIFGTLYFQPAMRFASAIPNSVPLGLLILALGFAVKLDWLKVFAVAQLLHVALDLPFHHDDGHAHFWPITMWIFQSPLSYWDPNHYGGYVGLLDMGLALIMIVLLWRRFPALWVRALLGLAACFYIAVPAYFYLVLR